MDFHEEGYRPSVKAADKPKRRIEADVILIAVGQGIESQPFEDAGMLAEWGEFKANEFLEAQRRKWRSLACSLAATAKLVPRPPLKPLARWQGAARNIDEYLGYHHARLQR